MKKLRLFYALAALVFLLAACSFTPPLLRPNGVAVAVDGSLYVMDLGNHRIAHLSAEGKLLKNIGSFGPQAEQIYHGWDIEIDQDGNLYIANLVGSDAGTIHDSAKAFSPEGKLLTEYGPNDYDTNDPDVYSRTPYSLALDDEGRIYLADFNYGQVRIFGPQGELLDTLFDEENAYIFGGLGDLEVDLQNQRLYVTDFYESQVVIFELHIEPSGSFSYTHIATYGEYGNEPEHFSYPQGIALDKTNGRLYIGDQGNRRIQVYTTMGIFIRSIRPPIQSQPGQAAGEQDPLAVRDWQVIGLELGPDGTLYAADALNNCIWAFDPDNGALLRKIEVQP